MSNSQNELNFKCPTCGATEGEVIGEIVRCCSCGNRYKRKHINDEVFTELHAASELRQKNQASDAYGKFVEIIADCEKKSGEDNDVVLEYAYYGKFLCEQNVRLYTGDDGKPTPSFWKVNKKSCKDSADFKKTLEYAKKNDSLNIDNYKKLAEKIEEYKQKYIMLEERGENYDVFICYKTKDETLKLGDKLCLSLTHQKWNGRNIDVFYSKLSLRSGESYEPPIYYALHTAKVLLVLCSSIDDLQSPWVKNEWFRFYHFAKADGNKIIIPIIMDGFDEESHLFPEEIRLDFVDNKPRQFIKADYDLISRVQEDVIYHLENIAKRGNRKIKTPFDAELEAIRKDWLGGEKDQACKTILALTQNKDKVNEDKPQAFIDAYMLQARMYSNNYKDMKNSTARNALESAMDMAKRQGLRSVLKENYDYRDYCAVKRKKTVVKTLAGVLVAIAVAAGGFGVYQFMQDPVVDAYVTGKPASVQVEYGEGVLSGISSITTVSKKGHEKEVELTNSMVSGFDPTKIGVQEIVISYGEIEIHLSVNVVKYTLSTPTGLSFDNGQITWEAVQKAESYTIKINDDVIENVKSTSYQGYAFEQTGVYSIQVKASADQDFGMDSAYTKSIEVVYLAQASNLKREGMNLSWDAVSGCNGYDVYINGEKVANVPTTAYTMNFDSMTDGDNQIYVVPANGKNMKLKDELTGAEVSDYDHNGEIKVGVVRLTQVSNLQRDGLELSWDEVADCGGYEIYVNGEKIADCEDNSCTLTTEMLAWGENQLHILPVGAQNLKLKEDLSEAERQDPDHTGQLKIYCYKQVSGITWKDGTLSWEPVTGAIYKVYINGKMVKTLTQTTYDIGNALKTGENTVCVEVSGVPYITSTGGKDYETNGTIQITKLSQVTNLSVADQKLTWDAVDGATSYKIYCNNELKTTVKTTSYEVYLDENQVGSDSYTVQACGSTGVVASDVSTAVTIGRLAAPTDVQLNGDILLWNKVQGASGYRVYAGNTLLRTVDADALSVNLLGMLERGDYALSVVAVGPDENMLSSGRSEKVSYHVDKTIIYITNEEELRNIVLKLDATYVLGADITLTKAWTPLGTTATPFTGHFNGNGHSIIGLDITATSGQGTGMFGVVGKDAVIEDLVIENAVCNGGNNNNNNKNVAIVAGVNNGTVRNVEVYGVVTAQDSDNVGGIVGQNNGSVYECTSHASVVGKRYVGGIVGNCAIAEFNLLIYGCSNYGEIQGTSHVGGVMGNVSVTKKTTIYDMHNEGNVTADKEYAGGIFGYISGTAGQTGTLNSCSNTGDICANMYAAGCFGYTGAYVNVTVNNIADTGLNCTNTGKITALSNSKFDEIYVH